MGAVVTIVCITLLTGFIFNRFLDFLENRKKENN